MTRHIYLNGMDHVAAGLETACRKTPGRRNHFVLALEWGAPVGETWLRSRLDALPDKVLRLLNGRRGRAWNLAPVWRCGWPRAVVLDEAAARDVATAVRNFADLPLPDGSGFTARRVNIAGDPRTVLLFKFSHRLFDGAGAELFLKALLTGDFGALDGPVGMPAAGLDGWRKKFAAGRRLNRALLAVSRRGKIRSMRCHDGKFAKCGMMLAECDLDMVRALALREAGPMMLAVYAIAMTARAVAGWSRSPFEEGGRLVLPVTVDCRKRGAAAVDVFFNQWGCLLFDWDVAAAHERAWWIGETRRQMGAGVGARLADDFREANLPMRILPERMMGNLGQRCFQGTAGSFMFSMLNAPPWPETIDDMRIENFRHCPAMPPSPGFGVFLNLFGNRLNLTLSYRQGVLSDEAAIPLIHAILSELSGGVKA